MLADYLQSLIDEKQGFEFSWKCSFCDDRHSGNLLKKVSTVSAGLQVSGLKTGLTLLDAQQDNFAIVQLSVKRKPDIEATQLCRDLDIIYIQVKLEAQDDFESLKLKLAIPGFVGTCFNPLCLKCGRHLHRTIMTVIGGVCYQCRRPMKVAAVQAGMSRDNTCAGPENFTTEELKLARSRGVTIDLVFSKTRQQRFLANVCPSCKAFVGEHYLFTDYICAGNNYKREDLHVGFYCDHCSSLQYQ